MKLCKLSKNVQYLIVILLGMVVFIFYGSNIKNIYTVWQIGDEPGYLMNAAFWTNHDWSSIQDVIPYYGYGYSVVLVPLFLLFHTGVKIIQGAIFINVLCVIITYFIQIAVMRIITGDNRLHILAMVSFVMCFYPYIMGEAFQIIAESLLVLLFWLSIFLFCEALEKQRAYLFVLYGFCLAYMFFTHTRALIILGAAFVTMLVYTLQKKINLKCAIAFGFTFILFFFVGYCIKKYNISSIYTAITGDGELKNRNIITASYIWDRLKMLFNVNNIQLYIYGFFAKLFYALASNASIAAIGACYICKKLFSKENKLSIAQSGSMLFVVLSFLMMFFACCVNGTGSSNNYTYFFYGRYFEYTLLPIVFMGIYECVTSDFNIKEIIIILILCLISGIISSHIIQYLDNGAIYIDAYRTAGFAGGVTLNNNFVDLMFYFSLIPVLVIVATYLVSKIYMGKTLLLIIVLLYFYDSGSVCVDTINQTNQRSLSDTEMAEYIIENNNKSNVYFINDEYKYYGFYARMQVLLPDIPLKVIQPDQIGQIEENSYYITYKGYSVDNSLKETEESIMEGAVFNLYIK